MPAMSRIALALGLTLGAYAAPNSITAPTGMKRMTVALLGGMFTMGNTFVTEPITETAANGCQTYRLRLDWLAAPSSGIL